MIYFIQNTGNLLVKIGVSRNPASRLNELQTGSSDKLRLLGMIPGDFAKEHYLHRRFRAKRSHGEWFHISERQVIEIIECEQHIENRQRQQVLSFPEADPESYTFEIVVQANRRAS